MVDNFSNQEKLLQENLLQSDKQVQETEKKLTVTDIEGEVDQIALKQQLYAAERECELKKQKIEMAKADDKSGSYFVVKKRKSRI